jgi:hypothetical protein
VVVFFSIEFVRKILPLPPKNMGPTTPLRMYVTSPYSMTYLWVENPICILTIFFVSIQPVVWSSGSMKVDISLRILVKRFMQQYEKTNADQCISNGHSNLPDKYQTFILRKSKPTCLAWNWICYDIHSCLLRHHPRTPFMASFPQRSCRTNYITTSVRPVR